MKKFFKALALVLALTLVVGTIPASAADLDFSLKKEKKIIYLGGASGEKEVDGATVKCGTKSRYKVSKLVNGFDPETMDIKLESADKSIVKTSNAKDKVYAKSIGKTDVTIFIYDKETDKQLKTLTLKVQVKKNATAPLAFVITDADGKPVDLTATKAGVNVPYIVTLPRKADGKFVDTDNRVLSCTDESVKIEAINKYNTQYKVTFTKSGTFPITAASFQSKLYPKLQNVVTVPVTAGYDASNAEQSSLDTVKVSFDTPVVGLTADNFKVVYTIDGVEEVEIPFADIAPDGISYNEDKTAAFVKLLMPFAANTNYIVYFDGKVAGNFKAVDVKNDSVKQFIIPTQYITIDTESDIKYQLLDANGVDITAGVNAVGGSVTFEITSDDANDYIVGEKVYVKNAHAVTVTGTYHYFDSESNYKSEPVGKGQVVAQTPEAYKAGKVEGMITDGKKPLVKATDGTIDGDVAAVDWTMDGAALGYLQIKVPYTKSSGTKYEGFNKTDVDGTYKGYTVEVADKSVALLQEIDETNGYAVLKANKPGSTSILIKGVKADNSTVVIGVIPVTIKDARKLTSWTVTSSTDKINLAYGDVTYTVTAKDQEGKDFTLGYTVEISDATDAKNVKPLATGSNEAGKATAAIKINSTDFEQTNPDAATTHNIKIVVKDLGGNAIGEAKTLRLSAKNDGITAKRYTLKLSGAELKTGVKTDTNNDAKIQLILEGITDNGTPAPVATSTAIKFSGEAVRAHAKGDTDDAGFYFTITKDGKLLNAIPGQYNEDAKEFKAFAAIATGAASKLEKGTYVINAYRVYLNDAKTTYVFDAVGSAQTFTVTDDQPAATIKKVAESVASFDADSLIKAFEIKVGDTTVTTTTPGYSVAVEANFNSKDNTATDATTAYIKAIKVTVTSKVGTYTYTLTPDTTLTLSK